MREHENMRDWRRCGALTERGKGSEEQLLGAIPKSGRGMDV